MSDLFRLWREKMIATKDISPLEFGMAQESVISIFGQPDAVSTQTKNKRPLIFKYQDIELHFGASNKLFLIYSDDEVEISIHE